MTGNIKKRRKSPEYILQKQVVDLLRWNNIMVFSVPNGGSRNLREAAKLKRTGVLAGVSDLIVLLPNKAIFLELKTPKGKQQKSQKDFQRDVEALGFDYHIARSVEEVKKLHKTWYTF